MAIPIDVVVIVWGAGILFSQGISQSNWSDLTRPALGGFPVIRRGIDDRYCFWRLSLSGGEYVSYGPTSTRHDRNGRDVMMSPSLGIAIYFASACSSVNAVRAGIFPYAISRSENRASLIRRWRIYAFGV